MTRLERELRLPAALCAVLVARGFAEPEGAKQHLRPLIEHLHPPERLPDAPAAAERLLAAARRRETVLVHGDYDVDGMCAAALLTLWLTRLGVRAVPFVPHRLRDGYDLGPAGLAAARSCGATLLLTADCGTVAHESVAEARRMGLDVIVTDHHAPGARLPEALAVVNPSRPDSGYPDPRLSGTGVAFKLCQLLAEARGIALETLLPHLDLVALATVADLVPLEGENRVLVRYGLRALASTARPGLAALLRVVGLEGEIEAGKVGFVLAPRLNAVGRIGDAAEGLRLLLTEDPAEASALAARLDALNRERQQEDGRTLEQAMAQLERTFDPSRDYGVVLAGEGWHPGVIGIVASRVVERIHRPTVLVALAEERGRGSARSIPGFDLYRAVAGCAPHLTRFGGHRQAAGMDLRRDALSAFREAFREQARSRLEGSELRPSLSVDLELAPGEATLQLAQRLRYLGPHGIGNPRPVFLGRGLELAAPARAVGNGHLRLTLRSGGQALGAIGFHLAERVSPEGLTGPVDVVFQLQEDVYRGEARVQARILDLRPAAGGAAEREPGSRLAPSGELHRGLFPPAPAPAALAPEA